MNNYLFTNTNTPGFFSILSPNANSTTTVRRWGLELREDSALCRCFITQRWGIEQPMVAMEVAQRMRKMHILHVHTNYPVRVREEFRLQKGFGYLPNDAYLELLGNDGKLNTESHELCMCSNLIKF